MSEVRAFPTLKGSDRVREACGRCGGSGTVSWGAPVAGEIVDSEGNRRTVPKVCFSCNGAGSRSVLVSSIRARATRAVKAAAAREAEAAVLLQQRAEKEATTLAARTQFEADHPDLVQSLATLRGQFGDDLRERLQEVGSLTENQVAAVRRIAAQEAARPAPAPALEGRIVIAGEILSVRAVESYFGGREQVTYKARILDDRGFTVWGSLPSSITQPIYDTFYSGDRSRYDDGRDVWTKAARGRRVQLTATVEQSSDDETFGFYKRPTAAQLLEQTEAQS